MNINATAACVSLSEQRPLTFDQKECMLLFVDYIYLHMQLGRDKCMRESCCTKRTRCKRQEIQCFGESCKTLKCGLLACKFDSLLFLYLLCQISANVIDIETTCCGYIVLCNLGCGRLVTSYIFIVAIANSIFLLLSKSN